MNKRNIVLNGVGGRMGKALVEAVAANANTTLSGALEHASSPILGQDAGLSIGKQTGISVVADISQALDNASVVIDFSRPDASLKLLDECVKRNIQMVIGTTGFDEDGKAKIRAAAEKIAIVFAPNFSVGVNLLFALIDKAARVLNDGYDIEVIESNHPYDTSSVFPLCQTA